MLQKLVTILYLSGEPLPIESLSKLTGEKAEEIEKFVPELESALISIGLDLLRSKEGFSIVTQSGHAALVQAFWKEELQGDLTPATLQVLTLVAYLESPTREEISYIRGVQSSQSIRTLTVRGLIARAGEICTLTADAMKHLGVAKTDELPEYQSIKSSLTEKLKSREG